MPPYDEIISWFFKVVIAGAVSFMWWGKKEDKRLFEAHSEEITKLRSTAVSEEKVREIVSEATTSAIHPMIETMSDIKRIVTDNTEVTKAMQIKMAEQEGYQKALKELNS